MAGVETPPYALQNASHGAQLFRLASGVWLGAPLPGTLTSPLRGPVSGSTYVQGSQQVAGSVGGVVGTADFNITQNGTPNMTVNVAGGQILIPGGSVANQGLYYGLSDASTSLTIATASASNPRIDTIIAYVEDAAYTGSNNDWKLQVVTGTATTGATLSNLTGAGSLAAFPNCVVLGFVLVPTSATTIVTADILNAQPLMSPSFGGIDQRGNPAGQLIPSSFTTCLSGTGTLITAMTPAYLKGGMTATASSLIVPVTGIYRLTGAITWAAGSSTNNQCVIEVAGTQVVQALWGAATLPYAAATVEVLVTAGQAITMLGTQVTGATQNTSVTAYTTFLNASLISG